MSIITTTVVARHRELLAMLSNPPPYSATMTVRRLRALGPPRIPRPPQPSVHSALATLERMIATKPGPYSAVSIMRSSVPSPPAERSPADMSRALSARYLQDPRPGELFEASA